MQITARAVFENGSWLLNVPAIHGSYSKVGSLLDASRYLSTVVANSGLVPKDHELVVDVVPHSEWLLGIPDSPAGI